VYFTIKTVEGGLKPRPAAEKNVITKNRRSTGDDDVICLTTKTNKRRKATNQIINASVIVVAR